MEKLICTTQQWMEKATAHIRSLKLHTHDLKPGEEKAFFVLQTIEDTGLLLAYRLRLSRCTLTVSCASSDEPVLHGDPGKLGQVLTNLIVNAIDAYRGMNRDGGEIRVEVTEDRDCVEIRVRDQDCGIPHENIGKIFDEFFSAKSLGEGTGLGLSIARDIVSNFFAGTISVESVQGQGSVFTLRIPRNRKRDKTRSTSGEQASQMPQGHVPLSVHHEPVEKSP